MGAVLWLVDAVLAFVLGARWLGLSNGLIAAGAGLLLVAGRMITGRRPMRAVPLALGAIVLVGLSLAAAIGKPRWLAVSAEALALDGHRPPAKGDGLELVSAADGIDRHEAALIMAAYFRACGPEFGAPGEPVLVGDEYRSNARGEPIHVDARTGAVRWTRDRPSFPDVPSLRAAITRYAPRRPRE